MKTGRTLAASTWRASLTNRSGPSLISWSVTPTSPPNSSPPKRNIKFPTLDVGCCAVRRSGFFVWNIILIMVSGISFHFLQFSLFGISYWLWWVEFHFFFFFTIFFVWNIILIMVSGISFLFFFLQFSLFGISYWLWWVEFHFFFLQFSLFGISYWLWWVEFYFFLKFFWMCVLLITRLWLVGRLGSCKQAW